MISNTAVKSLMEWTPISKRIILARFFSRHRRVTIIQVYAPHNERPEQEKDDFYAELQETLDECNKNDIVIVMGDLNAKVGWDNTGYERTMGSHGVGTRNENGERLCDFCPLNGLVITGTLFPHKDIHKRTYMSRDHRVTNQIDHLVISGSFRSSVLDSRVQRGADVNSDHYLVKTRIKLRLNTHKQQNKVRPRLDVERLKVEETRREYNEAVRKRLQETREVTDDVDKEWEHRRKAYVESAKEVLGFRKGRSKPWISQETWILIDERKGVKKIDSTRSERLKTRLKDEYRQKDREVKRSVREDKRRWVLLKAQSAEHAAENGWQKELHDTVKQLTGQGFRKAAAVNSKDGELLKSKEERQNRWAEHFQEVLNREAPASPPQEDDNNRAEELDISAEEPTLEEIRAALGALHNGKAPGLDQITAEMLKADQETTTRELKQLFNLIWREERVPQD